MELRLQSPRAVKSSRCASLRRAGQRQRHRERDRQEHTIVLIDEWKDLSDVLVLLLVLIAALAADAKEFIRGRKKRVGEELQSDLVVVSDTGWDFEMMSIQLK